DAEVVVLGVLDLRGVARGLRARGRRRERGRNEGRGREDGKGARHAVPPWWFPGRCGFAVQVTRERGPAQRGGVAPGTAGAPPRNGGRHPGTGGATQELRAPPRNGGRGRGRHSGPALLPGRPPHSAPHPGGGAAG